MMSVAFPLLILEFGVINHKLYNWLKFVYCSIVEQHSDRDWKCIGARYARKITENWKEI